jgi:hypothetical protein
MDLFSFAYCLLDPSHIRPVLPTRSSEGQRLGLPAMIGLSIVSDAISGTFSDWRLVRIRHQCHCWVWANIGAPDACFLTIQSFRNAPQWMATHWDYGFLSMGDRRCALGQRLRNPSGRLCPAGTRTLPCYQAFDKEWPVAIANRWLCAAVVGLAPVPLGWLAGYGGVALVRWIRTGFKISAGSD